MSTEPSRVYSQHLSSIGVGAIISSPSTTITLIFMSPSFADISSLLDRTPRKLVASIDVCKRS
uniref:Uncharacterized protein n=1 Tax=Arundo donax TaxID=35708 RepID=A0A0A8YDN0_ARUDO